ncbi:MAG: DUF3575 domain-containing protein [Microscillaceae bacterium]|nr:DUF3575 domain-containing protein [Microscillaceae bacterium]
MSLSSKICFLSGCLYFLFPSKTIAQPRNILKLNVLSPIVRSVSMSAEHLVSPTNSLQLGVFYTAYQSKSTDFRGFGITPEYRLYLDKYESPAGFFVNSFFRYQNLKLSSSELSDKTRLMTYGLGAGLGGQWVFGHKIPFTLEIYGGSIYDIPFYQNKNQQDTTDDDVFTGFNPRFGVNFGVAF